MPKPPAPSPSRKDPPLIAPSRGQFLSTTPHSGSLFSRNSKLYHPPIPSETNNIPEITKICNSTDRPALCVKFITPLYSSDTLSVLDKTITATAHQIKLARAAITNLAKTPTLQSTKQSDYEDCKESYEDALENLQNAKNAIPQLDIGTINSMLSAAVTDFSDCDDFSNNPHILKFDDILRNLVSTCLVVASSIK
ncbi:pectinesterase inhibitor 1 [Pistacia vera]|uniref:pectinesterase inhibitor 1 n=1 Tax=Pistacia vera TaxID=55513 RepID=UPI001262F52E|nr:pectinesterase inhibitor 1 [Pistacia vera]